MDTGALSTGAGFEVDGSDCVKLVLQFLHEQGLVSSAKALQTEAGVALNTVDSRDRFADDLRHGRWESVLPAVARMKLPVPVMTALYDQVGPQRLRGCLVAIRAGLFLTGTPISCSTPICHICTPNRW